MAHNEQTCLVAGGAGFIGSHLSEALLTRGYRVYALDNLITGTKENISHLLPNEHFTFVPIDITVDVPIFPDIQYIYHLASPASVVDYETYPEETALANSVGTRNLLKCAKAYKAKFLFTSTSEVYGDPREHPQKETYWGNVNPNGVRSCYDESKRFGEMMTRLYVRKYGVDARIVRIFNTYGPRMKKDDGRVISNFVNQALSANPITVYGDGKQTRSFCYVSDMVEGLIKAMETEKTKDEIINLGNPEEYTMSELVLKVKEMTKSTSEVIFTKLPEDDPQRRRPDIGKAEKLLGWKPIIPLDEGLKKTIEYYKTV